MSDHEKTERDELYFFYVTRDLNMRETARAMNRTERTIKKLLEKYDIPMRRRGGDRAKRDNNRPAYWYPAPSMDSRVSVFWIAELVKWWFNVPQINGDGKRAGTARKVAVGLALEFLPDVSDKTILRLLYTGNSYEKKRRYISQAKHRAEEWQRERPSQAMGWKYLSERVQSAAQRNGTIDDLGHQQYRPPV